MQGKNEQQIGVSYVNIDSIKPYEKNARSHGQEDVKSIVASIREFGFNDPIGVWNDIIVEGHGRWMAAKELGMETVPVLRLDHLTDEQRKAYGLAHNKTAELSSWNFNVLDAELKDIAAIDMSQFGFDMAAVDPQEPQGQQEIQEDDFDAELPEEPEAKPGDIYILGNHRLICGDCTDTNVIDKLMDGQKADMVFTDPPYGMKKQNEGVENDNLNYDDLLEFNRQWIPLTFDAMKENGSWYCWGTDEPLMDIYSEILRPMKKQTGEKKLTFRNLITWDKGVGMGQLSEAFRMYPIADEKCLFVMMGRQNYGETKDDYWEGFEPIRQAFIQMRDRLGLTTKDVERLAGKTTVSHWFAISQWEFPNGERFQIFTDNLLKSGAIDREEYDRIREDWYATRAYFDNTHDNMNDVWHFDRTSQKEREDTGGHATPKPIALCARAIKSSSREGEIVLDVFGGSGSTLIACEQTGRRCFMCEIQPKYVDVIVKRWEKFTGKKAVRYDEDTVAE